jgi:hypothetical protein
MSIKPEISQRDALEFLASDHKALLGMFRDYERDAKTAETTENGKAALRFCHRLKILCAIKEEVFYPSAKAGLGEKAESIVDEARSQMGAVRGLMKEVESLQAKDAAFDPAVRLLGDAARRHFEQEEQDIFPKLRHGKIDLVGIGEKLAARKLQFSTEPAGKADIREARRVLGS